jgi:hypothetical protein
MTNDNRSGSGSGYGSRDIPETAWGRFWATCVCLAAGLVTGGCLCGLLVMAHLALEWAGVTW